MSHHAAVVALMLAATALGTPADAFNSRNRMIVTDIGGGLVRVEYQARIYETDYWCAFADYAERVLGANSKTRLYRASPSPRKRGQGITFTLDPAKSGGPTGISTFGAGARKDSISLGQAIGSFCDMNIRLFSY